MGASVASPGVAMQVLSGSLCLALLHSTFFSLTSVLCWIFQDNVQRLYKTVCKFFSDPDLTTAVFALSVFTSLSLTEELGDKVCWWDMRALQIL